MSVWDGVPPPPHLDFPACSSLNPFPSPPPSRPAGEASYLSALIAATADARTSFVTDLRRLGLTPLPLRAGDSPLVIRLDLAGSSSAHLGDIRALVDGRRDDIRGGYKTSMGRECVGWGPPPPHLDPPPAPPSTPSPLLPLRKYPTTGGSRGRYGGFVPPWPSDVPCPVCGRLGVTLRVHDRGGSATLIVFHGLRSDPFFHPITTVSREDVFDNAGFYYHHAVASGISAARARGAVEESGSSHSDSA